MTDKQYREVLEAFRAGGGPRDGEDDHGLVEELLREREATLAWLATLRASQLATIAKLDAVKRHMSETLEQQRRWREDWDRRHQQASAPGATPRLDERIARLSAAGLR